MSKKVCTKKKKQSREWVIFHCERENCWVVSVLGATLFSGDVALGVAECPNEKTARMVLKAIQKRELDRTI